MLVVKSAALSGALPAVADFLGIPEPPPPPDFPPPPPDFSPPPPDFPPTLPDIVGRGGGGGEGDNVEGTCRAWKEGLLRVCGRGAGRSPNEM